MIVLLDEPFASVDQETGVARTSDPVISPQVPGPTIYVTHNAEEARSLAEHAVRLTERWDSRWMPARGSVRPPDAVCLSSRWWDVPGPFRMYPVPVSCLKRTASHRH